MRYYLLFILQLYVLVSVQAQQRWKTLADSANYYFATVRNFDKAHQYTLKMIEEGKVLHKANPQDSILAASYYFAGITKYYNPKASMDQADYFISQALPLFEFFPKSTYLMGRTYAVKAMIELSLNHPDQCIIYAKKAADLLEQINIINNSAYLQAQGHRVLVNKNTETTSGLEENKRLFHKILPVSARVSGTNSKQYYDYLMSYGSVLAKLNSFEAKSKAHADSLWDQIMITGKKINKIEEARSLLFAGSYHLSQNSYSIAFDYLTQAALKAKKIREPDLYLKAYGLLSELENLRKNEDESVKWELMTLADSACQSHPEWHFISLYTLSTFHYNHRRLKEATHYALEAQKVIDQNPQDQKYYTTKRFYPLSLYNRARLSFLQGNLSQATQGIEKAYHELVRYDSTDYFLAPLALYYYSINEFINPFKALSIIQNTQKFINAQPNPDKHVFTLQLINTQLALLRKTGNALASKRTLDSLFIQYKWSQLLPMPGFGQFIKEAGQTYLQYGQQEPVRQLKYLADSVLKKSNLSFHEQIYLHEWLGLYYQHQNRPDKAILHFKKMMALDTSGQNISYLNHSALLKLAQSQFQANLHQAAFKSYQNLIQQLGENLSRNLWTMSDWERINYLKSIDIQTIYPTFFQTPSPQRLGLAYNYKLIRQGTLLKTNRAINQVFQQAKTSIDSSLINQLINVRSQLAHRYTKEYRSKLIQKADSLQKQMGEAAIPLIKSSKTYTWQQVKQALQAGQAAVEIIRYNSDQNSNEVLYAALLLRPEWKSPQLVHLRNMDESGFKDHYEKYRMNNYYDGSWYNNYWKPIQKVLGKVNRVYFSPDGLYHSLNLQTLYNTESKKYLSNEIELLVLNSTQDIVTNKPTISNTDMILVGHPNYKVSGSRELPSARVYHRGGFSFEDLPYSKIEIEELAQIARNHRLSPQIYLDTAATESLFYTLHSPRILHIATHGFVKESLNSEALELINCGLVLAGAADSTLKNTSVDGILTGYEASLTSLHQTELVVLSACHTGNGRYSEHEGLQSLQKAFVLAGAQSVLMSLWKINDAITVEFMKSFYTHWLNGSSKPWALRQAQAHVRALYPEPNFWGAFVLIGQ
ncbi:CHAT domain-containing protein [Siphonobacter sp. SORGH_AS_1065]|uniref:CHAT domain-containing protein n=1 Tax=Siphonobacter sp. SORGH_AS_1065 TaxID=3041795 RepID=UPI0027847B73|nr:CHAT domain-containing protein [Siphonobacter sp. SORGH_AS_1065]MDQ1089779.1 CHAT domain-containing protein [Siphonobacter sp. SORGH_AS_1065]